MTQLSSTCFKASARPANTLMAVFVFAAATALFAIALVPAKAQTNSRVTSIDPSSGKVNDTVTAGGDGLAKANVIAVFLSDDKNDYKATIVDQSAEKIVFKVPEVKAGGYNVSIQVGNSMLIEPVRFTVQ
jgi:hypothetical protein